MQVQINGGRYLTIDEDDFALISQYNWHAARDIRASSWFAKVNIGKRPNRKVITAHRLVSRANFCERVFAIDGNKS